MHRQSVLLERVVLLDRQAESAVYATVLRGEQRSCSNLRWIFSLFPAWFRFNSNYILQLLDCGQHRLRRA